MTTHEYISCVHVAREIEDEVVVHGCRVCMQTVKEIQDTEEMFNASVDATSSFSNLVRYQIFFPFFIAAMRSIQSPLRTERNNQ